MHGTMETMWNGHGRSRRNCNSGVRLSYYNAWKVRLSVCHPPLAPSLLQGHEPRPRRLSPWALGTCPTLPPTCPHKQLDGAGVELPGLLSPLILSSSSAVLSFMAAFGE